MKSYNPSGNFAPLIVPSVLVAVPVYMLIFHPSRTLATIFGIVLILMFVVSFLASKVAGFVITDDGRFGFRQDFSRLFFRQYIPISQIKDLRGINEDTPEILQSLSGVSINRGIVGVIRVRYIDSSGRERQRDVHSSHLEHFSGSTLRALFEELQRQNPNIVISKILWKFAQRGEKHPATGLIILLGVLGGSAAGTVIGSFFGYPESGLIIGTVGVVVLLAFFFERARRRSRGKQEENY